MGFLLGGMAPRVGPEVGVGTGTTAPEHSGLHIKLTASFAHNILALGGHSGFRVNKALTRVLRVWSVMCSPTGWSRKACFTW